MGVVRASLVGQQGVPRAGEVGGGKLVGTLGSWQWSSGAPISITFLTR